MNKDINLAVRYLHILSKLIGKYSKEDIIRQLRYELTDFNLYNLDEFIKYNDIIDEWKYSNKNPINFQIIKMLENMEFLDFKNNNNLKNIYDRFGHNYIVDLTRRCFYTISGNDNKIINRILDFMEEDKYFIPNNTLYGMGIISMINELIECGIENDELLEQWDYDDNNENDIIDLLDYNEPMIEDC